MSEKPHRVTFIGDSNVGKTSIIWRAVKNEFRDPYATAAPCSINLKKVYDGNQVDLELVDTSGQEKFSKMNNLYYRGSEVIIMVYALNDLVSFQKIDTYYEDILNTLNKDEFELYLVGNKYDIFKNSSDKDSLVSLDLGEEKAKELNAKFYATSALSGAYIAELFEDISQSLFDKSKNSYNKATNESQAVDITKEEDENKKEKCC